MATVDIVAPATATTAAEPVAFDDDVIAQYDASLGEAVAKAGITMPDVSTVSGSSKRGIAILDQAIDADDSPYAVPVNNPRLDRMAAAYALSPTPVVVGAHKHDDGYSILFGKDQLQAARMANNPNQRVFLRLYDGSPDALRLTAAVASVIRSPKSFPNLVRLAESFGNDWINTFSTAMGFSQTQTNQVAEVWARNFHHIIRDGKASPQTVHSLLFSKSCSDIYARLIAGSIDQDEAISLTVSKLAQKDADNAKSRAAELAELIGEDYQPGQDEAIDFLKNRLEEERDTASRISNSQATLDDALAAFMRNAEDAGLNVKSLVAQAVQHAKDQR